jgi:antitoxin component YwqK of YwqJK toxin-antitoxin module
MKTIVAGFFLIISMAIHAQSDVLVSWVGDTNKVGFLEKGHYENCQRLVLDTSFFYETGDARKKTNWDVYYDAGLKHLASRQRYYGDTLIGTEYYRNGQKRIEYGIKGYTELFTKEWCENGTLIHESILPNYKLPEHRVYYYCNGQKKSEYTFYWVDPWGTLTEWYENGQKKSEVHFSELDKRFVDSTNTRSRHIGKDFFWNEQGDTVSVIYPDQQLSYDGIPFGIDESKINGAIPYYQVKNNRWYSCRMEKLKDSVYSICRINDSCYCKAGYVLAGFYVLKTGEISDITINSPLDPLAGNAFRQALISLGHWPVVMAGDNPESVYVIVNFQIEKAKRY